MKLHEIKNIVETSDIDDEMAGFTPEAIQVLERDFEERIPSLSAVEIKGIHEKHGEMVAAVSYETDDRKEGRGTITFTCQTRGPKGDRIEDLRITNATGKFKVDQSVFEDTELSEIRAGMGNFDLRDPDSAPGAAEREGDARSKAAKRLEKSNELMYKVADELGGKAKETSIGSGFNKKTYVLVDGIKFNTKSGKKVQARIGYDSFRNGIALYLEPSPIPRKGDEAEKARDKIKEASKGTGQAQYNTDFNSWEGKTLDWVSMDPIDDVSKAVKFIKAVIEVAMKF
jgi:hypothetical protein